MDTLLSSEQIIDEIDWKGLTRDLHRKRCVLFLGRSLPIYSLENDKTDFNTLASSHLAKLIIKHGTIEFDSSQSDNLHYTAHKFLLMNKNNRVRLEDEIADVYKSQVEQLSGESNDAIPALYKTILRLPWNTIVNMQPDNFFQSILKPDEVFAFYNYKPSQEKELKVESKQFLVYNLFGTTIKDNFDYNVSSLVLTEEDHLEFIRNLVSGKPPVSKDLISRFDNDKTFIFLDCNLENWDFRLLMEILKIHKESHTYSPNRKSFFFPTLIQEFYKNRYGFIFVKNNSEDFINKLWERYDSEYGKKPPAVPKKMIICYHDADEELMKSLFIQFKPWIDKNVLTIWKKEDIEPGADRMQEEADRFNAADSIVLLISAQFLNEPTYTRYVKPALESAQSLSNSKQVFAVIKSACPWQETPIHDLPQKYILPSNRRPLLLQLQDDPDRIHYEIASAIIAVLWE